MIFDKATEKTTEFVILWTLNLCKKKKKKKNVGVVWGAGAHLS